MNASKSSEHPPDGEKMSMRLYWKGYFDVVEARMVVVNPLYYREDNDVSNCWGSEGSRWSGRVSCRSDVWQMLFGWKVE